MIDNALNQILFALGGFLFGLFAARYGNNVLRQVGLVWQKRKSMLELLLMLVSGLLFFAVSAVLFPYFVYQRTHLGCLIYVATFLFFLARSKKYANPPHQ